MADSVIRPLSGDRLQQMLPSRACTESVRIFPSRVVHVPHDIIESRTSSDAVICVNERRYLLRQCEVLGMAGNGTHCGPGIASERHIMVGATPIAIGPPLRPQAFCRWPMWP